MPLDITAGSFGGHTTGGQPPTDQATGSGAELDARWVAPDYASIPGDDTVMPGGYEGWTLVWPGPALIMPAGLLPDGLPHGPSDMGNAERIRGLRPRHFVEADEWVIAYVRQQNALRRAAGLPLPTRQAPTFNLIDTPETLAAIAAIHAAERARRRERTNITG